MTIAAVAVLEAQAVAFEIGHTDAGELVRWHRAPSFRTSMQHTEMAGPQGLQALQAAAAVWNDGLPDHRQIEVVGENQAVALDASDYVNSVIIMDARWHDDFDPRALGATVRAYRRSSGALVDADIALNAAHYEWNVGDLDGCAAAFDLQAVLTHELGHALGLNHNEDDPSTVMFPAIATCHAKRALQADDLDGVAFLYDVGPDDAPGGALSCSAAGSGADLGLALLIAFGMIFRRRAGLAVLCAGTVLCGYVGTSQATVIRGVKLERLAGLSAVAVRGRIVAQQSVRLGDRIYTDTTIAVDECLRGTCGAEVVVRQLGGTDEDIVVEVAGSAKLDVGDEVVVFLRRRGDGAHAPLGMAQGLFVVDRTEREARAVRDTSQLFLMDSRGGVAEGRMESIDLDVLEHVAKSAVNSEWGTQWTNSTF